MTSWSTRPTELEKEYWEKLQEVYDSVDDIDLYVGGVGETSVRGGVVGPTFACLIADQVPNNRTYPNTVEYGNKNGNFLL